MVSGSWGMTQHRQPRYEIRSIETRTVRMRLAMALAGFVLFPAAHPTRGQATLPLEPLHESGQSVTGAYEGWFKNPDGTFSILFGYFNRNLKEEPDIPIGPNND